MRPDTLEPLGAWVFLAIAACGGAGRRPASADEGASCEERDGTRPEDLRATPRPDRATERLAALISPGVTAQERIYRRLVRDLTAMRRAEPSIASIEYRGIDDGRTLLLDVDVDGETWVAQHPELEELRRRFGAKNVSFPMNWVALEFDAVYDLRKLGAFFRRIPGVEDASTNVLAGDGPTICVDADAPRWTYYFVDAGGDCPAGCTTLRLVEWTSEEDGRIDRVGETDPERDGTETPILQRYYERCADQARGGPASFVPACPG